MKQQCGINKETEIIVENSILIFLILIYTTILWEEKSKYSLVTSVELV